MTLIDALLHKTVTKTVSTISTRKTTEQDTTHIETTEQTTVQTTQKTSTRTESTEQTTVPTTQKEETTSQTQPTSHSKCTSSSGISIHPTTETNTQNKSTIIPGRRTTTQGPRSFTSDPVLNELEFQSNRASVIIPTIAVVSAIAILLLVVVGFIIYKR